MSREDDVRGAGLPADDAMDEMLRLLREERDGDGGDDVATAARLDAELMGLLAGGLDERPPAPEVKKRLLAAVRGGEASATTAGAATGAGAGTGAAGEAIASRTVRRVPPVLSPPATAGSRRWLPALAAALLAAVVGLAFFAGVQYGELGEQRRTIAQLSDRLAAADGRIADLAAHRTDLASRLAMVATPGVEVCPLRPQGASPMFPEARGLLFLSGPRDEWYVRVANVDPAPDGYTYHLWFVLGDEVREAGVLLPGEDRAVVLAGRTLPPAGRMTAALVTLEPEGRTAARPQGPTVLYGDEKMDML